VNDELLHFPERRRHLSPEEAQFAADCVLAVPIRERTEKASALQLEDPETILTLIGRLWERMETSPTTIRDDAEFFYRFLERPRRPIGLFDEREYFLGEFALIAGSACRALSRRKEARLWFDRAGIWFLHVVHELPQLARVAYQRLTVRMEERQIEQVMELLPALSESFVELEMGEAALKCRFIEGAVLIETGKLREAVEVFRDISKRGEQFRNEKLLASAYVNLAQVHSALGESEEAMAEVHKAAPLLRRLNDRIALGKLQWGLADLLRKQGQVDCDTGNLERGKIRLASAIETYRTAQKEFAEIGMKADVAALHLVIADLLLDVGHDHQARREIHAALPVIDELELASEGFAALSLLRKSLSNHSINRQALRDLHGYFEDQDS